MLKKFSTLLEYITWLYKYNSELQKTTSAIFRVIKIDEDENGDSVIEVQVINKATIFKCGAKEVVAQDKLLECFSKNDVRVITYLATKELFEPKSKIIALDFDDEAKRTTIKIKTKGSDNLIALTPEKISNNNELINKLSQADAHKTGYLMAIEQMLLEKQFMESQIR